MCNILGFYAGPYPERIETFFCQSALGKRDKWIDRPDYRARTVAKALEGRKEFYRPDGMLIRKTKKTTRRVETVLSPAHHKQGMSMAIGLAESHGRLPDWQASFELRGDFVD